VEMPQTLLRKLDILIPIPEMLPRIYWENLVSRLI